MCKLSFKKVQMRLIRSRQHLARQYECNSHSTFLRNDCFNPSNQSLKLYVSLVLKNRYFNPYCKTCSGLIPHSDSKIGLQTLLICRVKHSCKTHCPDIGDCIAVEIVVSQHWTLPQHFCRTLCPGYFDTISGEIEVKDPEAIVYPFSR